MWTRKGAIQILGTTFSTTGETGREDASILDAKGGRPSKISPAAEWQNDCSILTGHGYIPAEDGETETAGDPANNFTTDFPKPNS